MPDELIGEGDVVKGHYSKAERREQIRRFLNDGKIRATSEIARALQMKNSSALRNMLLELWVEGRILAYKESGMYRWQKPKFVQLALELQLESERG